MTRRLRVLEISKSTGGVGSYMRWLAQGFDHTRYQLTFVCLSEGGPELAAELQQQYGVQARSLTMNRYKLDPFSDTRVLLQLARLFRSGEYDLIHAHASKPGYLARLAALGSGIPVLYSPHCFSFHPGVGRLKATVLAGLERAIADRMTARIMTVCDDERDIGLQWKVGRPELFTTVHTGIDSAPFMQPIDRGAIRRSLGVPENAPLIGAVGRLIAQKAPLDLVQAAAIIHAERPDAHIVWVGDGPLEEAARAAVAAAGLQSVFHFAGLRRDVPALLQALDLFVLPSHWEGFSLSVLEAMAAGLPVAATNVTGSAEAIADGENGFIVPIGDSAAMAAAVLKILADPARARQFGAQSRERIQRYFTRERMISQIAQLYDDVYRTSQHRSSPRSNLAHSKSGQSE